MSALVEMCDVFLTNLKRLRQERNILPVDLARRAGVNPSTICRIENGTFEPKLSTAIAIARVLGVGLAELVPSETYLEGVSSGCDGCDSQ